MKLTAKQIKSLNSPYLQFNAGDESAEAYRPWPPEVAPPGSLVFVSTPTQMQEAIECPAGIIVGVKGAFTATPKLAKNQASFITPSIQAAMALLLPFFDTKPQRIPPGISPLASIDPTAELGQGVSVAAFTVIGAQVKIGAGVRIGPNCVVEKNAKIGARTLLHSLVHIGAECELGEDCEIHPTTCIGSDGFGFAIDPEHNPHKIPQIGRVVIGDRVEIGSGCSIDRATLTETTIGSGTKFDNQIHIAHNCKIGKNCLFAAGFMTAGSIEVGDNFKCGGDVQVADHIKICANVTIGGKSGVTKDITEPGAYIGFPVLPWKEGLKTLSTLANLPEMRRDIKDLKLKLDIKN